MPSIRSCNKHIEFYHTELRAQSRFNIQRRMMKITDKNIYQQSHKHTSLSWKGLERMVRLPSSIGSWKREGMCSSWSFSYEYRASLYAPSFRLCLASAYKVFLIMGWRTTHVGGTLGSQVLLRYWFLDVLIKIGFVLFGKMHSWTGTINALT